MKERRRFLANRILVLLSLAAILAGLYLGQWNVVRRQAVLLCYACMGLGETPTRRIQ